MLIIPHLMILYKLYKKSYHCPYSNNYNDETNIWRWIMTLTFKQNKVYIYISFFLIYLLNCLDLIFTYTFLKTGLFCEVNPIMQFLLGNVSLLLICKVIIPAILLSILCSYVNLICSFDYKVIFCVKLVCMLILALYIYILGIHIYNLVLYTRGLL